MNQPWIYMYSPSRSPSHLLLHLIPLGWECKLVQPLWRTVWRFLKKLELGLPYDPAIPLLGIHTEETRYERDTCTPVFTALWYFNLPYSQPFLPSPPTGVLKINCFEFTLRNIRLADIRRDRVKLELPQSPTPRNLSQFVLSDSPLENSTYRVFLFWKIIYLFIWGHAWVFIAARSLFKFIISRYYSLAAVHELVILVASLDVGHRSWGKKGSIIVVHGLICLVACGISPDQESNLVSLHWR